MFLIIFSIILSIILMAILSTEVIYSKENRWDGRPLIEDIKFKLRPRTCFGLLPLLLILFGCFATVQTGEIGIKTSFGKIVGTTTNEGIVLKLPYEKVKKVNIKVQKYENKEELSTSTKDMQIVEHVKVSVNYQINKDKAVDLYKNVGTNYQTTVLEPTIQETIKSVISKYTAEELVTKRSEVALAINDTLNERVQKYGITSISVAINNFDFSQAYNQAIEKKAVAEQEAQTSKNQLEKAKIDAERKKVEAEGEAAANRTKEKTLTDNIIKQQFIQKWNGQLPSVIGGNGVFNITDFIK